ncbi:dCTP deaminase domain-containing protein [Flavobacterium sp.]|uniref:dCTP deaminase domain-containing protein n=1 Tax=Flavobacterium sp. TaxID=239 RepID=UPI003BD0905D
MSLLLKNRIKELAEDSTSKLLGNDFEIDNIQSSSYDLRIGTVFKNGNIYSNDHNADKNWNIEIKPSEIITILSLEEVNMPLNVAGTVFAINSLSSTGFLILNPGHIDPGFKGPISICAINLSKSTIRLHRSMKIFTILFDVLEKNAEPYDNAIYKTRKETEEVFYRKRASKLSNSFFDLIMENEYTPYLKELIKEEIKERSYILLKWFFGQLVTISTILSSIYIFLPSNKNSVLVNKIEQK